MHAKSRTVAIARVGRRRAQGDVTGSVAAAAAYLLTRVELERYLFKPAGVHGPFHASSPHEYFIYLSPPSRLCRPHATVLSPCAAPQVWTESRDAQEAGGIYLFRDRPSAEAYITMHAARLKGFGIPEVSYKIFDVNEALTDVTKATLTSKR